MKSLERRSKDILFILAESKEPITTKFIGDKLNVSSRTITRQMPEIENYLNIHGFKFTKKPGYGIIVEGNLEEKNRLKQLLHNEKIQKRYSPQERQLFILIELLKNKEPIKIYRFKSDLNVTEGTISLDLDKIEDILAKYEVKLVRRPGLGVYIDGTEANLRKLIVNLIYENNLQNDVLDILGDIVQKKNNNSIAFKTKNKLLNMIDKNTIRKVEKIVSEFERNINLDLNDSQYVALTVHLALVVERIKNGDEIHMEEKYLNNIKNNEEYVYAKELSYEIENNFNINMPEDEIGYITMHLLGSKKYFDQQRNDWDNFFIDNYRIIKTAKAMIRFIQNESKLNLMQDEKILINLTIHLEPAIKRIIMGMEIRNPLLGEIKENYPYIFKLSKKASSIIEKEFNIKVPDTEVGYIALHIGGALERNKNYTFNIVVVCPSGIGASGLLSTKISNEFLNIEVIDTVSAIDINNIDLGRCDFIVSTVPINIKNMGWVLVNPLLLEEDKKNIKNLMNKIPLDKSEKNYEITNNISFRDKLIKDINYSKAIMQVLDNYKYYDKIYLDNYENLINKITKIYTNNNSSYNQLKKDILHRESLGQLILEESSTIIIHCRTETVDELQLGIIKILTPLIINKKNVEVEVVVILLAPSNIESEYIEIMSYITQSIFKSKPIKTMTEKEIYQTLNNILEDFYFNIKTKRR
ncbi:BglG family transcription antiterminator [Anaerosalibacter massiliensis]|uniref:Transcription antiterminator n=1 Tax=Anaerosalibacter massiliensis TaxID=1347392 RepID=A0A9X2MHB7_9FIRM|nr:transcription antiterminator [Anaerosalibacter massiliensis]MCR2045157.1 transcription antiterminator [Anaerosalibacter massiliensis]